MKHTDNAQVSVIAGPSPKTARVAWTAERIAELRDWARLRTAADFAAKHGLTEAQVKYRAARAGILFGYGRAKKSRAELGAPKAPVVRIAPRPERVEPVPPTALPFIQAKPRHCAWPLWRGAATPLDEKLVCGERRVGAGPYCPAHRARSFAGFSAERVA